MLLTKDGCLERQRRLRELLAQENVPAAMVVNPHHIHYLTGWWMRPIFQPILLITQETSTLALPYESDDPATVDQRVTFVGSKKATIVDDQYADALRMLEPAMKGIKAVAIDIAPGALLGKGIELRDLSPTIRKLKRTKLADEVAVIRKAISGAAAAYAWVRENLKPGVNEIDVYNACHAAAVKTVGEPIGEFGNDFTCGGGGGAPRDRAVEAGELYVLDLGVTLRGYSSDLCRSFAVSEPTAKQLAAQKRCVEALDYVQSTARPGVSCRKLHDDVIKMLDGYNGWNFGHHLGHGIGLFPHESPRLNNAWDDTLMEGDVFACEPGLYGDDLRTGIRIEDDFVVTATGVQRLSEIVREIA